MFTRLERLLTKAKSVLDYFEPYLGRIEIQGSANRIERVYFEIKQSHIDQWEKPQIKVGLKNNGAQNGRDFRINRKLNTGSKCSFVYPEKCVN